jgi:hypothetical protein
MLGLPTKEEPSAAEFLGVENTASLVTVNALFQDDGRPLELERHEDNENGVDRANGQEGNQEENQPEQLDAVVADDENSEDTWRSYRIDMDKVPDSVLAMMWRRSVDPKHCTEAVTPLEKVPRLTVTKREVQQLPAVNDIQHWQQVNKRRKEQRKAREESEVYPSLNEMLRTIFGVQAPPKLRVAKDARPNKKAQIEPAEVAESEAQSATSASPTDPGHSHEAHASENPELQQGQRGVMQEAKEVHRKVQEEMIKEAFPIDAKGKDGKNTQQFVGVIGKGRRNGFDEGQPWTRAGWTPLAELQERKAQSQKMASPLQQCLETVRVATAKGVDEDVELRTLNRIAAVATQVQEKCDRKVSRMQVNFLKKQGQLSSRLQRRVKRLQMDFEEIHDMKVVSILPSVVTREGKQDATARGETVLSYLKRHRHVAEKQRQSRHAIYLQQVERFQGYLRLLADPNRSPDRGEIYLSECFRHVLAAGLIVDDAYFFRVLDYLGPEDFEKVATVNLLAACCHSFEVDLRKYWAFLEERQFPLFKPRPRPDQVRSWEDWAPWAGVDLVPSSDVGGEGGAEKVWDDSIVEICDDPFPFFSPIVPDGPADTSELVSRDDPLAKVLQEIALDSVLERYQLSGGKKRTASAPSDQQAADKEDGEGASSIRSRLTSSHGAQADAATPGASAAAVAAGSVAAPDAQSSRTPWKPAPPGSRGPVKPSPRRHLGTVGGLMRAMAAPIGEMPRAPDKDRPRAAGQMPAMMPIAESREAEP